MLIVNCSSVGDIIKKIRYKITALLLAGVVLSTGCNGSGGGDDDEPGGDEPSAVIVTDAEGQPLLDESGNPVTEPAATKPPETSETTKDPHAPVDIYVGFIYNGSVAGDTLVTVFEKARGDMERLLGVRTCYIDNVLTQQFQDAVETMRADGVNVIVAASNHFSGVVDKAAKNETGGLVFINLGTDTYSSNEDSLQPAIYEAANICGLAASFNTDSNQIGIVADNNLFHALGVVDAFSLGVQEVPVQNLFVQQHLIWALSDSNSDTKRAIDTLVAEGCDIIFLYQTSEYGIKYCESIGVRVMGMAFNLPELAPTQYLTGYYLNVSSYLVDRIQKARRSSFDADWEFGGLKYGIVGLIQLNADRVKPGTADITAAQYEYIVSGKNKIFVGEVRDKNNTVKIDKGITFNLSQIYKIDWVESHITKEDNFSGARTDDDLIYSDLEIRN